MKSRWQFWVGFAVVTLLIAGVVSYFASSSPDGLDATTLRGMLSQATELKKRLKAGDRPQILKDKVLAMIFERQSTRTRVSFDVGMRQLGGETIMLSGQDMQLAREETLLDTGRVMSRYVDAIMIRILSHADLVELSEGSSVPVINGLTRRAHPCQVMADLMTFEEHRGNIKGAKVAWVGDSNNVLHSWVNAAELFECELTIAVPDEYWPEKDLMEDISKAGKWVKLIEDPREAVANADLVLTDTWVSMGDTDAAERRRVLKPYQVNTNLMALAKKDALFMHCLPAHRGEEVAASVVDGPQSVVIPQAHNRLHAFRGVLRFLLEEA